MNLIKTGCAILNQTPLDWNNNTQNILTALKLAKKEKISLVCFPELSITGYGCEDAFHASYVTQESFRQLELILPHTKKMAVCLGLPVYIDHALFNGSAFICDGKLAGIVCKRFLAGEGVHYESRWFKPWPCGVRRTLVWKGKNIPVGDLVFKVGDFKIGIEICEDAWTSNRPAREFAGQGVNIVLNPSASHFAFGKLAIRKQILIDSSRFCQALYLYSNLNGCEAGRIIYDGGGLITFCGRELAQGKRFSYEAVQLLTAVADMDEIRLHKSRNPNAMPDFKKSVFFEVPVSWHIPKIVHAEKPCPVDSWEHSVHLKKEEFTRAVGLGLYDYLRKSSSRGFVLSLSGGMDSSGIAVLIYYMIKQIGLELGQEELRKR
ncbi:MAG: NAD+ synthetase, partial [Candidatus Aureabacteria bacterium]|nr:NAD+ synthetase [Candidatus Auribacterota bacterium]